MTVFVNDAPIEIEKGFSVRHAILRFDESILKSILDGPAYVSDEKGDEIDLDGALFEGERLYVRP